MLRFLDSFLSLSHISFAPSWQSVRAVTVQLWKSSQYLARNRTNRRSRFISGARGPWACVREPPRATPPYFFSTTLSRGTGQVGLLRTSDHPRRSCRRRGCPRPGLISLSPGGPRGPSSREPSRTRCAALAPRPAQTDCSPSSGKARKTVLSHASCLPLMPLSSQDGYLLRARPSPLGFSLSPPPRPFCLPPSRCCGTFTPAFALFLPPLPFVSRFPIFPFFLLSFFVLLLSLLSCFLCSVPHFLPILARLLWSSVAPRLALHSPLAQVPSGGSCLPVASPGWVSVSPQATGTSFVNLHLQTSTHPPCVIGPSSSPPRPQSSSWAWTP